MVPTQDTSARGRSPLRVHDALDDDDWTVYSDTESVASGSTASQNFFPTRDRQDCAPVFRLKRGEQSKPVYEAWNIYYYPSKRETFEGFKVLGVQLEDFEDIAARVELRRQPSTQAELTDMHLQAIESFGSKHKRSWPARALRGKAKSYEQDLDERCTALPRDVKTTVTDLLFDRGKATSTHYRTRTWTVSVMREQLQDRFAQVDFAEVKRHKLRFWKNPKPEEHLLYSVVIRGTDTKVPAGEARFNSSELDANPWIEFDRAEARRRIREEREQRDALRSKRHTWSPSFRTRPPLFRRSSLSHRTRSPARTRSVSPPSYRSPRRRYVSSAPSTQFSRDESPPPYQRHTRGGSPIPRYARSESPIRSRSPSVRIRVVPRYSPSIDDAPFPPTPPESYTPPPGVSAYPRPAFGAPPFPAPYTRPFQPRPPPFPAPHLYPGHAGPAPPPGCGPGPSPFPHQPFRPAGVDTFYHPHPTLPPTPANCPSCIASCRHYPRSQPCYRPVVSYGGVTYHPPCAVCTAGRPRLDPSVAGPMPMHTGEFNPVPFGHFGQQFGGYGATAPPPPPPLSSRPPSSWFSQSPGPMPPAPNPFSPLSTPPLTSCGGSSPVLSSRVRTPVVEGGDAGEVVEVRDGGEDGEGTRAGSPAPSGV